MKDTIIIAGSIAQQAGRGGHTWVFLQYILGFKKLGYDVVVIDHLQPEMCRDTEGQQCAFEDSVNVAYFVRTMNTFDLADSFSLLYGAGGSCIGIPRQKLLSRVSEACLFINVMGFIRDEQILGRARRRVFLDIDPGFGQMWQALGLCSIFEGYDSYVTVGENIGRDGCTIPTCGLKWITSRQPVQLDYWKPNGGSSDAGFTTVASWRGRFAPIEFRGKTYGLRVHEFRKLVPLPKKTGARFEIALDIHPADQRDKDLLEENGWNIVEPNVASGDPLRYRDFVRSSGAEFMVAKNMYVETGSGWFSDRSTCYLAAGKPVLAQDTGLAGLYPAGKGLLLFKTLDEAAAGVEEISRSYAAHAREARQIAVECFDSDKVLQLLLDKLQGRCMKV